MVGLLFLCVSLGLVAAAAVLGGQIAAFASASSALLVIVGTCCITAISFRSDTLQQIPTNLARLFGPAAPEPGLMARQLLELVGRARRDGIPAIESARTRLGQQPFLARALGMIADGVAPDAAERLLKEEADSLVRRQLQLADVLRRAADIAPAMGLIGTLIGLVDMLGNLTDPEKLGPAMGLALLTTLYGAVLAHVVLLPLAVRAESQAELERAAHLLCAVGVAAIGRRDHPLHVEAALNSLLPAGQRVRAA